MKIKLIKIGEAGGVIRLASQLSFGRDEADFILEDGILKVWCFQYGGTGFYKTDIDYEIVESEKELITQKL